MVPAINSVVVISKSGGSADINQTEHVTKWNGHN